MKKNLFVYPYAFWLTVFIVVPLLLVMYYGLTVKTSAGVVLSLENFNRFLEPVYLKVMARSILLALVSTVICLIVGYPMAMILADRNLKNRNILVLLFVIPMWMNFLLRTYAWMTLLENHGIINTILALIGLPPLKILYTDTAVVLGMVYNFLPFMVLPIYSVLARIDRSIIEAAQDLGANSFAVFRKITLPVSFPGVLSGITMVFMPAVTTFVISRLLGGGQYTLVGNLIEQQFLYVGDWNFGSTLSLILMLIILLSMGIMSRYEKENEGSLGLW